MPRPARIALTGLVTLLMASAVYLYAVRGPAMLLDMATAAGRMFCL